MKTLRYALSAVIFMISLFFGYQAGQAVKIENRPQVDPLVATLQQAPQTVQYANGQRSILLMTVNSLSMGYPELESVWLVALVPPDPHLTLLPVYPSNAGGDEMETLADTFELIDQNGERQISPAFLVLIRNQEIGWTDTAVIDKAGIEMLIAYADSSGQVTDGSQAPSSAGLLEDLEAAESSYDRLEIQSNLFQQICWDAAQFDIRPGLSGLFGSLHDHLITSTRPEQTLSALNELELSAGGLYCEFPTRRDW